MKNEFVLAFNEVLEEKQLPKDIVLEALQAAMVSAYRRSVNASNAQHIEARIDPDTGKVLIYAEKEVVDSVENLETEVSLEDAHRVDPTAELGSMVVVETTPDNFGRIAAQTARQVIQQRIREAEREAQYGHFSRQIGEIISGVVQAVSPQGVTLGMEMKAEGVMPRNHQIPGERFRVHDRVRALLLEVKSTSRGPQIVLSRAHRNFLRRLLENEVPEIYHGMVEIRSISREPGQRSKVAVSALQPGVDPVGACVGLRGVRIQAIVRELNDEKIDVIEWSADPVVYIAKSLSPARVSGVYLNDLAKGAKTATVVVPEDQLSLAIGRDGQNARLAAKLTSWRIDIKSLPEAASDALYKLQNDPLFAEISQSELDVRPQVEQILAKKTEGRPVTPEEYQLLTQFVDRIERGIILQHQADKEQEQERVKIARDNIPPLAFQIPLEKFEVSDRVYAVISEAGFPTVGDLMLQMKLDSDSLLALKGMGPKGMKELEEALDRLSFPGEEVEGVVTEVPTQLSIEVEPVEEQPVEQIPVEAVIQEIEEPTVEEELVSEGAEMAQPVEELPVTLVEEAPGVEEFPQAVPEAIEEVQPVGEAAVELVEPEPAGLETSSLEELFALRPEILEYGQLDEEEEEDEDKKKGKKKRKKKFVEMEYDPDRDAMIVKKKRRRGADWGNDWEI